MESQGGCRDHRGLLPTSGASVGLSVPWASEVLGTSTLVFVLFYFAKANVKWVQLTTAPNLLCDSPVCHVAGPYLIRCFPVGLRVFASKLLKPAVYHPDVCTLISLEL